MRGREAIGPLVWRVPSAVIQSDVVDINASTIADAEAVDWVVLDVNVMHRALTEHLGELDEMVWPETKLAKVPTLRCCELTS